MWLNGQNFDKPIKDRRGRIWHIRVWHDFLEGVHFQRIFFWSEDRKDTGVLEFAGARTLHVNQLRQRISKLISNPDYRTQFRQPLVFPVERHY